MMIQIRLSPCGAVSSRFYSSIASCSFEAVRELCPPRYMHVSWAGDEPRTTSPLCEMKVGVCGVYHAVCGVRAPSSPGVH
jgi:hypothetical protein